MLIVTIMYAELTCRYVDQMRVPIAVAIGLLAQGNTNMDAEDSVHNVLLPDSSAQLGGTTHDVIACTPQLQNI